MGDWKLSRKKERREGGKKERLRASGREKESEGEKKKKKRGPYFISQTGDERPCRNHDFYSEGKMSLFTTLFSIPPSNIGVFLSA